MVNQNQIDRLANLWNKTKCPKYKELWYKLVNFRYGKNLDNTSTFIRWDTPKRTIQPRKTNGSL